MLGGSGEIRTRDQRIKSHVFTLFRIIHGDARSHLSLYLKGFKADQVFTEVLSSSRNFIYRVTHTLPRGSYLR